MDVISRAIEESRINEGETVPGGIEALLQIEAGPALFIHETDFERMARQAEHRFNAAE